MSAAQLAAVAASALALALPACGGRNAAARPRPAATAAHRGVTSPATPPAQATELQALHAALQRVRAQRDVALARLAGALDRNRQLEAELAAGASRPARSPSAVATAPPARTQVFTTLSTAESPY